MVSTAIFIWGQGYFIWAMSARALRHGILIYQFSTSVTSQESERCRVNSSRNSSQCHKTVTPEWKASRLQIHTFPWNMLWEAEKPTGERPLQHREACKHVQLMHRMINVGLDSQQQHLVKSSNVHRQTPGQIPSWCRQVWPLWDLHIWSRAWLSSEMTRGKKPLQRW